MTELTKDTLFDGRLICWQNKSGYRFSVDAVLLAHFCLHWKKADILDLGCGCGILGCILLYRNIDNITTVSGIEYQNSLVEIAQKNILQNDFAKKMSVRHGDYRKIADYYDAESFSHVICNPPFYQIGRGRTNDNTEAFLARHQAVSSTGIIAESIAYVLKNKGEAGVIFPAENLFDITRELQQKRLEPKKIQFVYSYPGSSNARLVLLLCRKNGGEGVKVQAPLFLYTKKNGEYTRSVKDMYAPFQKEISG